MSACHTDTKAKQATEAKSLHIGPSEMRALQDLKQSISDALSRRPLPKGKLSGDVLWKWFDMKGLSLWANTLCLLC